MNKYEVLFEYVRKYEEIVLSFDDIKEICGFEIDHSFLKYKKELGYYVKISLKEKKILFRRN